MDWSGLSSVLNHVFTHPAGQFLISVVAGLVLMVASKRIEVGAISFIAIFGCLLLLGGGLELGQSGPTAPPPSLAAVDADGCATATSVDWQNHEPIYDLSIDPTFGPCQTMMVSSRTLQVPGGPKCDNGTHGLCVLVVHNGKAQSDYRVDGLTPTSWYGVTSALPVDAIKNKQIDTTIGWFSPDNCQGGFCTKVSVFTIYPNGSVHEDKFTSP